MVASAYFWLERVGQGWWIVRHHITGLPAGEIRFNGTNFSLTDDTSEPVGASVTLDALYQIR